jgi:ABC-2 type transport system ATP-binding protein
MTAVVSATGLAKRYRDVTALDEVGFTLRDQVIHGLLGRNGAGKTTLMQVLTGQLRASAGELAVFGAHPYENAEVLRRTCFIKESQHYPRGFSVDDVLMAARGLFPRWDEAYARSLVADFNLPPRRRVRKLSRGMRSALGVTVGLASRAELTLFDEPYLGLDATSRQLFYDRLLADYAGHPRTVLLSTHLIDEVAELIERVLVLDRGRLVVDEDADALRGQVVIATGPAGAVDRLVAGRTELYRERLGGVVRATLRGDFEPAPADPDVRLEPVSLQQFVVRMTMPATAPERKEAV